METLILLFGVALLLTYITKKLFKKKPKTLRTDEPELKITVSLDSTPSDDIDFPDTGSIAPTHDGGWVLNPKSTFLLTIYGTNESTASKLKKLLDEGYSLGAYNHASTLVPIIARSNLRCKEIDDYVNKFKPQYLNKIEEQKSSSSEWAEASEGDREDLLVSFREQAIGSLDIRPDCELVTLFEGEPADLTLDDALIDRFGFETLQLYLRYAGKLDKVRVVPADHYERKGFEKMIELGLAIRGKDIPLPAIIETLRLKDMNEMVADLIQKPFGRKSKAIEFLMSLPDIQERTSKVVAFRELFQLKPLPDEFSQIDLSKISDAWNYANEIGTLIARTYAAGGYASQRMSKEQEIPSYISGWEVSAAGDEATCPFCRRAALKTYSKKQPPRVPLHISCRCTVLPIIKD